MRLKPSSSLRTHFLRLGQSGCMKSWVGLGPQKRLHGVISIQYFHLFYFFIFALVFGSHYEVQTTYYTA